ncbi:MAG: transcription-repair coupling factor [Eubacteriales bacterium]|nr:transcription-repair coupling factor [Eubacteriales bacterium]
MNTFVKPLSELAEYEEIQKKLKSNQGLLQITGCIESQKVHFMYGLSGLFPCRLILAEDERRAKEIFEDYRFYDKNVWYYPAKDLLFFQADIQGNLLLRQRVQVIQALMEQEEITVITSIDGCMDYLRPLSEIGARILRFEQGSILDIDTFAKKLSGMGYERVTQVELAGQFSVRGGIIDIYSLTEENPWRIELWGDEIDSIRSFDAESQRSLENLDKIHIYPAAEQMGGKQMVSFLDYFPPEQTLVILDELNRLSEKGRAVEEEYRTSRMHREERGEQTLPEQWICDFETLRAKLNARNCAVMSTLEPNSSGWKITGKYALTVKSVSPYNNSFELLVSDLEKYKQQKYRVALLSGSRTRAERLARDLQEKGLNSFYSADPDRDIQPSELLVTYGHVKKGFEYPFIKFVVMSESDIFGREQKKKVKKKTYSGQRIQDFAELSVGDYVIHENHGLGIYRGIEKVEIDRVVKDYIKIEYEGKTNLYILATQLDVLQKYGGSDAKTPKLNKIGSSEWHRTKNKVRTAVRNIARELVELYAARQEKEGFVCGPDTVWQKEFEEMFPYEETEDQLAAIADTKRDMESTKIMDRLICGDVGYGKTEVALRAAFKAVQESRQVVYLVPTTILAQQHYNTFFQRMKDFPVRVELLCRFRTPAQIKKTLADLKKGLVDVVIGTHRVLSKDVVFKNLGLLIIDEEQRFGVTHKEKIKQLKKNVDVLTLTATPIPRTLHMSLIGIRDMSVLEQPPMDRIAIQTYVMEYDEETVREAITREVNRGGQVFYVYNRVNDIADVALRIAKLVPDARVDFAHGQMSERELEKVMYNFINGDTDVLVTTTIIETGLDISNANTMIIHDSDRYGLSQLYQLRGRIGRSNRTSYAFLMYRKDKILQETAEKRLSAIREFTDLGSGFKIAMRDLELRGAGNLLGAEQHGHMGAVGYDLYCKMLTEAVKEARGIPIMEDFETTVDMDMNAFIPDSYISNEYQKLDIYKRIAGIESDAEYDDMLEELIDRFGEPPKTVQNLLVIAALKAAAHQVYIQEIRQRGKNIKLVFYENAQLDPSIIPAILAKYRRSLTLKKEKATTYLLYTPSSDLLTAVKALIRDLKSLNDAKMAK